MGNEQTKFCSKCKTEKGISGFNKDKSSEDGLFRWCRQCSSRMQREYRKKIPKEIKYKTYRKFRLQYTYGLSIDDYNKMFEEQQGCCAVCGKHQSELKRVLDVEHNHLTGKIRGLTCVKCNLGLSYFDADSRNEELLLKAINYLRGQK